MTPPPLSLLESDKIAGPRAESSLPPRPISGPKTSFSTVMDQAAESRRNERPRSTEDRSARNDLTERPRSVANDRSQSPISTRRPQPANTPKASSARSTVVTRRDSKPATSSNDSDDTRAGQANQAPNPKASSTTSGQCSESSHETSSDDANDSDESQPKQPTCSDASTAIAAHDPNQVIIPLLQPAQSLVPTVVMSGATVAALAGTSAETTESPSGSSDDQTSTDLASPESVGYSVPSSLVTPVRIGTRHEPTTLLQMLRATPENQNGTDSTPALQLGATADPPSTQPNAPTAELGGKIIPFPLASSAEPTVIPVDFRSSAKNTASTNESETQLPETPANSVISAAQVESSSAAPVPTDSTNISRSPGQSRFPRIDAVRPSAPSATGTSVARKEKNMDFRPSSTPAPTGSAEETSGADLSHLESESMSMPQNGTAHRGATANEWISASAAGRVNETSSTEGATSASRSVDVGASVERISKLIARETTLVRQHGSESMSVVLQPDAGTELLVHLSQRNGQIEASVRCERGDYQQLNALWSQLQESLSRQKVQLAPLQGSANDSAQTNNFNGGSNQRGRDESSAFAQSHQESMEEWPAPASLGQNSAHVRSGRESGRRLSTSRPGWETWA